MSGRSFDRRPPARQPGRRILIACEGLETEPNYFHGIRISRRLSRERILIVRHQGTDPLIVVRAAVQERDLQLRERAWGSKDQAWAVIDCDEHRDENPQRWNEAVELAHQKKISLAVSNPSFELWYLLHYQDQSAFLRRDEALSLLRKRIPSYEKAAILYPKEIQKLTSVAIERARQLDIRAQQEGWDAFSNPSTGVWRLVESLLGL